MEFCIRLDDACPQMNLEKWNRIEHLLDQYEIKPLVGVIPDNQDPDFQAEPDHTFWEKQSNGRTRDGRLHYMAFIINWNLMPLKDIISFLIPEKQNGLERAPVNNTR